MAHGWEGESGGGSMRTGREGTRLRGAATWLTVGRAWGWVYENGSGGYEGLRGAGAWFTVGRESGGGSMRTGREGTRG